MAWKYRHWHQPNNFASNLKEGYQLCRVYIYLLSKLKEFSRKYCILTRVKGMYFNFFTISIFLLISILKISSKSACVFLYIFSRLTPSLTLGHSGFH